MHWPKCTKADERCVFPFTYSAYIFSKTNELRSEVEQSILTQKQKTIFFEMLVTTTSLRKKKLHTRKHFKKLVFRVFHVLERFFFSMMDNIFFFDPKMVPFDDFWWNSMKTKEKHWFLTVFLCFSLVLGDPSKNHEMPPSSDRKKNIIHHRKKNFSF